ncbi:MAG: multicopper oxidase domain-containing protein [Pyrobaculum sp.]
MDSINGLINPTLLVKRGEEVNLELVNAMEEETIIHWHGFHVDWRNDAHPAFSIKPGERYSYKFIAGIGQASTYTTHIHTA